MSSLAESLGLAAPSRRPIAGIRLEGAAEAETRLLGMRGLPAGDLFRDRHELVEQAYDMQSERIAYVEQHESAPRGEHVL